MKKPYAVIKYYMNGDDSGQLYTKELDSEAHYDYWMVHMASHIEIFSEKF